MIRAIIKLLNKNQYTFFILSQQLSNKQFILLQSETDNFMFE